MRGKKKKEFNLDYISLATVQKSIQWKKRFSSLKTVFAFWLMTQQVLPFVIMTEYYYISGSVQHAKRSVPFSSTWCINKQELDATARS